VIAIIGQVDVHPEDAASVAELMGVLMNQSMLEPGCHHYAYARDLTTPNRFQLSELWENEEALAAHFETAHLAAYRAAVRKLRVLARRVQRFDVSGARDL